MVGEYYHNLSPIIATLVAGEMIFYLLKGRTRACEAIGLGGFCKVDKLYSAFLPLHFSLIFVCIY